MAIIVLMIVGAAAGYLAARIMRVDLDVPTIAVIGVSGALIGGFALKMLIAAAGLAVGFIGALLGSMVLIWFWRAYVQR